MVPAPRRSALLSASRSKMPRDSSTAAEPIETAFSATAVSRRMRLATENERWKQRWRICPEAPAAAAAAYCSFIWPRICGPPPPPRSRTSTGAERWLSPTRTIPRSIPSERLPVVSEREHVHAHQREDDHREARDGERRRPAPAPAGGHPPLEEHHVDAPDHEREEELRIRGPEPSPRRVRPDDPAHHTERQEDEPPHQAAVVHPVEGLARGQVTERRGRAARLQPPLLHQVEEARAEGEREDGVAQDREHDADRQPGAGD